MAYILAILIGFVAGFVACFLSLESRRRTYAAQKESLDREARQLAVAKQAFDAETKSARTEIADFTKRIATTRRLEEENLNLKRDLRNLALETRKQALDLSDQSTLHSRIREDASELARRYLSESVKWISKSITQNNFAASKKRLLGVIDVCRKIGFPISESEEASFVTDLQREFELVVRAAFEREEQARIRSQIREEARRESEIKGELARLERERQAIELALTKALADVQEDHSAEIAVLKQRLAEAEEKSNRVLSQAQLTKSGHVYVISNIGSFGEGVYKIGMTRRLEPMLRIKELGDASVPFPFDIHMMISTDNAPELEKTLHREFHKSRLNRVNPRKEFFRSDLNRIVEVVKSQRGEIEYVADAEALEYRQSLETSVEDQQFIDQVFEGAGFDHDEED